MYPINTTILRGHFEATQLSETPIRITDILDVEVIALPSVRYVLGVNSRLISDQGIQHTLKNRTTPIPTRMQRCSRSQAMPKTDVGYLG